MAACNHFRFIGICYGNPKRRLYDANKYRTYFTLAVDSIKGQKKNFVPFVATGDNAEKAHALCRSGNKVAVIGEVITTEVNNFQTGQVDIKVHFMVTEIMMIHKAERTLLNETTVSEVIGSMPIEHKERNDDK